MKEEELLITKAQQGDEQSFGTLYDRYMPQIYRFIFLKTRRKQDAEDLTHIVFMHAWEHIKGFSFQGFPFTSWLYRIAHNTVIDHYRTSRSYEDITKVPEEYIAEPSSDATQIDQKIKMHEVQHALTQLDADQQNVILMKFVNELSNKEIALALEKTEGAVRVIQHRALKNLRALLVTHEA